MNLKEKQVTIVDKLCKPHMVADEKMCGSCIFFVNRHQLIDDPNDLSDPEGDGNCVKRGKSYEPRNFREVACEHFQLLEEGDARK